LAASVALGAGTAFAWTGVTEGPDQAIEAGNNTYFSAGIYQAAVTETGHAISANATPNPASSNMSSLAASFR
ncbi:MAG: hypothetical protein WC829_21740, partial [Hyphomicrobium sp.]